MTKVEAFESIKSFIPTDRTDLIEFCDKQVSAIIKKNSYVSNKPTAKQVANEGLKLAILNTLTCQSAPMTIKDIWENTAELCAVEDMSSQRISALLTQLKQDAKVQRVPGKVATFAIAEVAEEVGE